MNHSKKFNEKFPNHKKGDKYITVGRQSSLSTYLTGSIMTFLAWQSSMIVLMVDEEGTQHHVHTDYLEAYTKRPIVFGDRVDVKALESSIWSRPTDTCYYVGNLTDLNLPDNKYTNRPCMVCDECGNVFKVGQIRHYKKPEDVYTIVKNGKNYDIPQKTMAKIKEMLNE